MVADDVLPSHDLTKPQIGPMTQIFTNIARIRVRPQAFLC
jgi:hypothetical protein